jgi:tRNA(Ile)-lysidine synthase
LRLWRPLLDVSRGETRAYCRQLGLAYVDDPSNDDRRYARNAVRLDVLPALEQIEPDVRASLLRLADEARAASVVLSRDAARAIVTQQAGEVTLSRAALREMPPSVAAEAFRLSLVALLGNARDVERRHYAIAVGAANARTGATFELPRGVRITVDHGELLVTRGAPIARAIPAAFEAPLPYAGVIAGWRLAVSRSEAGVPLPAATRIRGRRPGDRVRPLGMGDSKKLQDYYVDRHVPRRLRDAAPVIALGSLVLWTPFGRCEQVAGADVRYAIEATPVPA